MRTCWRKCWRLRAETLLKSGGLIRLGVAEFMKNSDVAGFARLADAGEIRRLGNCSDNCCGAAFRRQWSWRSAGSVGHREQGEGGKPPFFLIPGMFNTRPNSQPRFEP